MSTLQKFKVLIAGKTTIQDLNIEATQGDVFAVSEEEAIMSSSLRKAIKAGWIKEVSLLVDEEKKSLNSLEEVDYEDNITDIEKQKKDIARREEKAAQALTKEKAIVRERHRTLKISSLKELKAFKKANPGAISEELTKDQQLLEMSKLQGKTEAEALADLGLRGEAKTTTKKPKRPKKKESTPETVKPAKLSVEEVVASKGKKKVKKNVAPKRTLPSDWDGMAWKERVAYLKQYGKELQVKELEQIIDENGPAVKAVAKEFLRKKKQQ